MERRPRNRQPRISETMAALAEVQALAHRLTPLYREAYDIALSKRGTAGERISGGDKSDPTGETASCTCTGSYHSCSPAQIRRAAEAISDAEDLLRKAQSKINSIFDHSQEKESWDIPKRWRPAPPLISRQELDAAAEAQAKRRAQGA